MELRPEPTAEKKAVNNRLIPSPSPRPLPKGEGEPLGSSGRAKCASGGVGWEALMLEGANRMWRRRGNQLRSNVTELFRLNQKLIHNFSGDVGQPKIASLETVGQFFMVQTE